MKQRPPLLERLQRVIEAADTDIGLSQLCSPYLGKTALKDGITGFKNLARMRPDSSFFDKLYERGIAQHLFLGLPVSDTMRQNVEARTWPILRGGGVAAIVAAATGEYAQDDKLRLYKPGDLEYEATIEILETPGGLASTQDLLGATCAILTDPETEPERNDYRMALARAKSPDERAAIRGRMIGFVQDSLRDGFPEYGYPAHDSRVQGVVGTIGLTDLNMPSLTSP